jgi:hypothetical protein
MRKKGIVLEQIADAPLADGDIDATSRVKQSAATNTYESIVRLHQPRNRLQRQAFA